jgi:hypothetical protein
MISSKGDFMTFYQQTKVDLVDRYFAATNEVSKSRTSRVADREYLD